MNNRKQKIEFLKGLSIGKRSIEELKIKEYALLNKTFIQEGQNIFLDLKTNKKYSSEEITALHESEPEIHYLIIMHPDEND